MGSGDFRASDERDNCVAVIGAALESMTHEGVRDWLKERAQNAMNIALEKSGDEKGGWLEDAAFYCAAVALVSLTCSEDKSDV